MRFFALLLFVSAQPLNVLAQSVPNNQKFICNTGYTLQQCHRHLNVLRPVLDKFHAETLGEWTWILVRSADWKPLMYRFDANPDSPAISFLKERTTLFEEALVEPIPDRRAELMRIWGRTFDELLDEAVSHELGHLFCNDSNEARADRRARALQQGKGVSCGQESRSKPHPAAALQP